MIKAKDLAIGYGHEPVAEHINFSIDDGDYLCIIGENGAGKSTLLRTMLGFLPILGGKLECNFQNGEIGYLPQQADYQKSFPASVGEIVLSGRLGRAFHPFYSKEDKEAAMEAMHKMAVTSFQKAPFGTLSGGQKQRVLLARALCSAKQILFLDEPVTGLDPDASENMYRLIRSINMDGITIVMISHDKSAIEAYPSHILQIGHDEIQFSKNERRETSC